jgi:hypothetical protein
MNIPRFWAKAEKSITIEGQTYHFVAWKGSDSSLTDAQRLANEALAERLVRKERGEKLGSYPKDGVPLREEMIEEIKDSSGNRVAVITRNAAGCLVLNTARVMFIDLDIVNAPYLHGTLRGCLTSLFVGWLRKPTPADALSDEEKVLEHIRTWHSKHPDWGMRVYRTKRGFRLLVTHDVFNPTEGNVTQIMQELGADKRYMLLCGAQSCFRARLTPKPWRIKLQKPSTRYPWETPEQELLQREWEEHYHQVIKDYSVCTFVETLGVSNVHPEVEQILHIHDRYALSTNNSLA